MKVQKTKGGKCEEPLCTCKEAVVSSENKQKCVYELEFGNDLEKLKRKVKENYMRLARVLHPDRHLPTSDQYTFGLVSVAYHKLREKLKMDTLIDDTNDDLDEGGVQPNGHLAHQLQEHLRVLEINVDCSTSNCEYLQQEDLPRLERRQAKGCTFTTSYIFYDCECTQDSRGGVHIPNFIVTADFEDQRQIFTSRDEFCSWAISSFHRDYTFIAHYGNKYLELVVYPNPH